MGLLDDGAGERNANEERSNGSRNLHSLGQTSNQKHGAESREEDDLVGLMREEAAQPVAVANGDEEHDENGRTSDGNRNENFGGAAPGDQYGNQWKIEGHHEIFEDKDGEHGWGFRATHAIQLREHPGDDAGGGNEGDAAEQDRRQWFPTEQESGDEARRKVEQEVDRRSRKTAAQILLQFFAGVFEAEHEEQQKDADFGAYLNEVFGKIERSETSVAESEPGDQIEGNGGESPAAGESAEEGETDGGGAQLDEHAGEVMDGWGQDDSSKRAGDNRR